MAIQAQRVARARLEREVASEAAFNRFFVTSYEQTLGLVALAVGGQALAEDAAQEAFARAFKRWAAVSEMAHPDRWVARVAINLAIDHLRRTARETTLEPVLPAPVPDHVEALWVQWNLDRLTPMQRATVVRRYIDGMPVAEVASAMGRSPQTVKTHLRLGRRRLREFLSEDRP